MLNTDPVKLGKFHRNDFHSGQLVTSSDLNHLIKYFNDKLDLLKVNITGTGPIYQLQVTTVEKKGGEWITGIEPGAALALNGREIIVDTTTISIDTRELAAFDNDPIKFLKSLDRDGELGLFLEPTEMPDPRMVTRLSTTSACDESCISPFMIENFKAYFDIVKETPKDPSEINNSFTKLQEWANDYYDNVESQSVAQEKSGVLIAILKLVGQDVNDQLGVDTDKTKLYRKPVYNNTLLYSLITGHIQKMKNVVRSINNFRDDVVIESEKFDIDEEIGDDGKPNKIKIEPKRSYFQIFTGRIKLDYTKDKVQDFGPVHYNLSGISSVPAVLLASSNPAYDTIDFTQNLSNPNVPNAVNFAPVNANVDFFNIRLTNPAQATGTLRLRYFVLIPSADAIEQSIPNLTPPQQTPPAFKVEKDGAPADVTFKRIDENLKIEFSSTTPANGVSILINAECTYKTKIVSVATLATPATLTASTIKPATSTLTLAATMPSFMVASAVPIKQLTQVLTGTISIGPSTNGKITQTMSIKSISDQLTQQNILKDVLTTRKPTSEDLTNLKIWYSYTDKNGNIQKIPTTPFSFIKVI